MAIFAPTLAQQDLILAFQDQLGLYGHTVTSTGTNSFSCLMTPANSADPDMLEMFSDLREVSVITALNSAVPSNLVAQMTVTDETSQAWVLMKRIDNPSEISVQFWAQKVTDKD